MAELAQIFFGRVKFFNQDRAFGFIEPDNSHVGIFFHKVYVREKRHLEENEYVSYELTEDSLGRPLAVNIKRV